MIIDFERIDPELLAYIVLGALSMAVIVYGFLRYRRYATLRKLRKEVGEAAYDMLMDVLIPDGMDGQLHVDFLLLTQRGILVLNLRETPGMIFGGDQMDEWTVMTRKRRYSFANPQGSLFDRVAAVRLLSGDTPVEGKVLFTARSTFPKGQPKCVIRIDSLKGEYSPVDRASMQGVIDKYRPDWERVKANATPSDLKRY
jgi:hypothetical protein